ncbi:hypothetical protein [Deinococcus sp. QL22]|nr:hypothetical protein [Deinococcus sp. QL22]UQN07409.1 hypothetical protein M1R55_05805 [Deinococcus sp. QL22]
MNPANIERYQGIQMREKMSDSEIIKEYALERVSLGPCRGVNQAQQT